MPRKITPTLTEALENYLRSRHHLSTNTMMNDRSVLQRFVRGLGADRQIGNVTPRQVERWFIDVCAATNANESSYNKVRARVSSFLQYCARHGWVKVDLLQDVGNEDACAAEGQLAVAYLRVGDDVATEEVRGGHGRFSR